MGKIILTALIICLSVFSSRAQDLITCTDGSDILAKIVSTNVGETQFKYWGDSSNTVYVLPNSSILMVRYENGEVVIYPAGKDVLNGGSAPVVQKETPGWSSFARPGMDYDEYKDYYDPWRYVPSVGDPYSRGLAAVGSVLFTGLGQGINGEWGKALNYFGLYWGFRLLAWATADELSFDNGYSVRYSGFSALLRLGATAVKVCSVVNAVRMAKIKNMYYQDLRRGAFSGVQFDVQPFLASAPSYGIGGTAGDLGPVAGLTFSLKF